MLDLETVNYLQEGVSLSESSREITVLIAGCLAKKLKKHLRSCCDDFLVGD